MPVFHSLVIICTGNICRSPIAEGLFKAKSQDDINIISAGTQAVVGGEAHPLSQQIMEEHGFTISSHRAQQATEPLLKWADLILVLDQSHIDWVIRRTPHLRGRVYKLTKWRGNSDIADPIGK